MSELYGQQHRLLQDEFDTTKLADRVKELIVVSEIPDEHKAFIESRDMFFLTTIDHRGFPTCSYKGGAPGFVKVLNNTTIVFPSYDGNGMFLSMGNIQANNKIGMLLIDFETPHRIRIHGTANPAMETYRRHTGCTVRAGAGWCGATRRHHYTGRVWRTDHEGRSLTIKHG